MGTYQTIDRALSGDPFRVDQFRCLLAAEGLRSFQAIHREEKWSSLPLKAQLIFKILFISICHQFNWDFLQEAMAGWLLPDPEAKLGVVSTTRPADIAHLLSNYPKSERVQAIQRARMLRTTAKEVQGLLDTGALDDILSRSRLGGAGGFYDVLRSVSAFAEDELEKKIRVLAHDLHRERIVVFVDPENLRPAVEYHLLRLYIRSGRVYPTGDAVREHLTAPISSSRKRLVILLRKKVEEAMQLTAFYAKMDVATLNYVEWQIGRSVCTSDAPPRCTGAPTETLAADVAALSPSMCLYSSFCRSFTERQYGWYNEPRFQKAIY